MRNVCWLVIVFLGNCYFFCTSDLFAQNTEQGTQDGQAGQQATDVEGFWKLSDEERLRDELPSRPTPNEIEKTRETVNSAFRNFLQLWEEERYFELYELGKKQSRGYLSSEEFATRMVRLDWVSTGLVDGAPFNISFRYRTLIYVDATIQFHHKTNAALEFQKRQPFLLLWESGKWRFDLLQMLRAPFYTSFEQQ